MTDERLEQEEAVGAAFERFASAKRVLLEVELRDHTSAALPVRFALRSDAVLVRVSGDSLAIDRLEESPAVRVASCTRRGKPSGEPLQCRARVLGGSDAAATKAAIDSTYSLWWRIRSTVPIGDAIYVELTPFTRPRPVGSEAPRPDARLPSPPQPAVPEPSDGHPGAA